MKRFIGWAASVALLAGLLSHVSAAALSAQSNAVTIYSRTTSLTAAQIQALDVTPVSLVGAPGGGKMLVVQQIIGRFTYNTQAFNDSGLSQIRYAGLSSAADLLTPLGLVALPSGLDLLTLTASEIMVYSAAGKAADNTTYLTGILADVPATLSNLGIEIRATSSYAGGPIASTTLNAAGSGYAATNTFTISGGNADATGVIDTVNGGGAVLTYHTTANGTNYVAANAVSTTGGAGSGFKVNITGVTNGDGTLKVTVNYSIADVS